MKIKLNRPPKNIKRKWNSKKSSLKNKKQIGNKVKLRKQSKSRAAIKLTQKSRSELSKKKMIIPTLNCKKKQINGNNSMKNFKSSFP